MRHLLRRILFYIAAVWASATMNFFIPRMAPGDPVQSVLGKLQRSGVAISPETVKALATSLGLHSTDPIWVQYVKYLNDILHGDFGRSFTNYPTPVMEVIGQGIGWTIGLGVISVIIGFVLGCLIGLVTAWRRGTALDSILSPAITFFYAVPPFWLALCRCRPPRPDSALAAARAGVCRVPDPRLVPTAASTARFARPTQRPPPARSIARP